MTHRGAASGFAVVSGHDESSFRPVLDALPPGSLTVVVLMGLARRAAVAACLLDRGWPADTAAAIVCATVSPRTCVWSGTLGQLGTAPHPAAADIPGTIVIGNVVELHAVLDETGPDARGGGGTRGPELTMTWKDRAPSASGIGRSPRESWSSR